MSSLAHRLIRSAPPPWPLPDNLHYLYAGRSGTGKTGALLLTARAKLADRMRSLHVIDPEGEMTEHLVEFVANPANGLTDRVLHVLKPSSPTESFGLGLLDVPSRDIQACHEAALRARSVFEQVVDFGIPDYGPRLSKLFHLAAFGLALTGRPLIALPDVYSSAADLRATIGEAFPYQFMSDDWRALDVLNARAFIDYLDALKSRTLPIFGSPLTRRVYGQQSGRNLDIARVRRNREVVLLDLSGLEHKDSKLIGSSYFSLLSHDALSTPLEEGTSTDFLIDEVSDYLTPDVARGFDRLRKRNVFLHVAAQRFAQFLKPDDPTSAMLSAVLTNTQGKIVFGGLAPDDAELMTSLLTTGHIELDTIYKSASLRPTAVGNDKVTLSSRGEAYHHIEQSARAVSDMRSEARARAVADATTASWSAMNFSGQALTANALPDGLAFSTSTPLSQSWATNRARGRSAAGGRSRSRVSAQQVGDAHAESTSTGSADGISTVIGTHEAMVTRYADLPCEAFSLEEKIHAVMGLIMSLEPRQCLVKLHGAAPILTRTPDLPAAFRCEAFRREALPLYRARLLRISPYLRNVADIDAEIERTIAELKNPKQEEPDFASPESVPIIDDPRGFARDFLARRADRERAASEDSHNGPPGRAPLGDLSPKHDRFRVIEGPKPDGDKQP